MFKRHEEELVYTYVCVGPWLEGKFGIMEASTSVVTKKKNYDGNVFSSNRERSPVHFRMSLVTLFCCSVAELHLTLCSSTDCSTPDFPVLHSPQCLLKLVSIDTVMLFNHLLPHRPLLLLPSIFLSIRVFSNKLFASGGQSIRASALAPVLPTNIQDIYAK